MSTALIIGVALALAGGLAWWVARLEASRERQPTPCDAVLDAVFAQGSATKSDVELLPLLLKHRRECLGDPGFVDQVRRLLLSTQRVDQARALLKDAEWQGTFKPDELKAQVAWVDLTAAHVAWSEGEEAKAKTIRAGAVAVTESLRESWPEWSVPYRILEEADGFVWVKSPSDPRTDYLQLERQARRRLWTGAWVRSLQDWQPLVFVFLVAATGLLALGAGLRGAIAARELTRLDVSSIASAQTGYVKLEGKLQAAARVPVLLAPYSKKPVVWYEVATVSGFKSSGTQYDRSEAPFVVRDASGEAVVVPAGITVRTRHTDGQLGGTFGTKTVKRVHERVLQAGDEVCVLGELTDEAGPNGNRVRTLKVAGNGRQLLVSNYSEAQLVFTERLWLWVGLGVGTASILVLLWSYQQRYHVIALPGLLR